MLVRYTKATVLLRKAQEFFPHSFSPLQTKLQTWPSLIYSVQARHIHTYSDTKDALKTGVRNVKENKKEGVKNNLKIVKWIRIVTSADLVLFDLSFANWYNHQNERIFLNAFEHGSCSEPDITQKELIYCEVVIKQLRRILEPISGHCSYHIIVGSYRSSKTTVIQQCARDVGKEVIYVDISPILDNFIDNFAKAIGYSFNEYVSFTESFKQKIIGNREPVEQPRFLRVLDAFERGARKYKANNSKPPLLIINNINGQICNLKEYSNLINRGMPFEEVRKTVLSAIDDNFHQAQMIKSKRNHVSGKVIVQEMLKNKKIGLNTFIKLVNNKQMGDELLQANVFSYNPESRTVTF
ncbi:P-loop containing nucleoside triphosphate hydrolase protein [Gigaspora margarita]|uniref:P-loop containing nucleoside triphosphate hydrolase protein n=1 Tax=Gigaspora margarita TaxID=4874 RepID=A0A8H4A9J2_GIGMA|nr:P-loop containing nucleoside triphosphate hydrolase protein [Gigaspora margarita]